MRTHDKRREVIRNRVDYWARRLNVRPRLVRVQRMTQKWGFVFNVGNCDPGLRLGRQGIELPEFRYCARTVAPARAQPRQTLQGTDDGSRARLEKARCKKAVAFGSGSPSRHKMGHDKHLIVVYREQGDDGFIITAFLTSKARLLVKRRQIWP